MSLIEKWVLLRRGSESENSWVVKSLDFSSRNDWAGMLDGSSLLTLAKLVVVLGERGSLTHLPKLSLNGDHRAQTWEREGAKCILPASDGWGHLQEVGLWEMGRWTDTRWIEWMHGEILEERLQSGRRSVTGEEEILKEMEGVKWKMETCLCNQFTECSFTFSSTAPWTLRFPVPVWT